MQESPIVSPQHERCFTDASLPQQHNLVPVMTGVGDHLGLRKKNMAFASKLGNSFVQLCDQEHAASKRTVACAPKSGVAHGASHSLVYKQLIVAFPTLTQPHSKHARGRERKLTAETCWTLLSRHTFPIRPHTNVHVAAKSRDGRPHARCTRNLLALENGYGARGHLLPRLSAPTGLPKRGGKDNVAR